jgi:glucose/arabinose dehydrogenase
LLRAGRNADEDVGVAIAKDGSVFVTDDGCRSVWNVTYVGK